MNRIHATLHPECFSRLAAANGYAPPDERLEIPFFAMAQDDSQAGPRQPPDASDEDLAAIRTSLAREEARRKAARCGVLRLLADGVEKARLDTAQPAQTAFAVDEGTEIIEVYGRDAQGELLLTAHLLDWNATQCGTEMTLADGKKISFAIYTRQDEYGFPESAEVTVACRATGRAYWRSFLTWPVLWKPALALGLLALVTTAAWFAWSGGPPAQGPVVQNAPGPVSAATPAESPAPTPPAPANVNPITPQPTPAPPVSRPVMKRPVAPPRAPKLPATDVKTEPAPALARKEKAGPRSNAPLAPRDDESTNPRDAEASRGGWDVKLLGLPLSDIKLVTVQAVNEGPGGAELVTALTERLSAAGPRFVPAPDVAGAEGALKISLRPAMANGQIVVTAYLVNDQGRVVWPARPRASGRRYTGTPQDVAARIVADLVRAAK